MDVNGLVAELRPALDRTLVATDFDGTLAPLVPDPEQSRPVAGAVEALTALALRGADVAVVTGRSAQTVLRLSGLERIPGLRVEGVYGIESWTGGILSAPPTPPQIERLHDRLPELLRRADVDPGVWIEDKRLSLVVHARRVADPDGELAKVEPALRALADALGLEVHPGAQVLELRLPGYDKAGALARLAAAHDPLAVLYLGDDVGDVPAFEEIARLRGRGLVAYGVGVRGAPEVAAVADVLVDDAHAIVKILAALAR